MSAAGAPADALDYALRYAALHWPVFPLHSIREGRCTCGKAGCTDQGKHPLVSGGLYAATTEVEQITDWWTRFPYANVGVATGQISGFFVLDVDADKAGLETLQEYVAAHGQLERTVIALTGGGGLHIYCRYPGRKIINRTRLGPGLDIRGDGGYVVCPPSLHISGHKYEWRVAPWA